MDEIPPARPPGERLSLARVTHGLEGRYGAAPQRARMIEQQFIQVIAEARKTHLLLELRLLGMRVIVRSRKVAAGYDLSRWPQRFARDLRNGMFG